MMIAPMLIEADNNADEEALNSPQSILSRYWTIEEKSWAENE